jgi:hypothetical protein
LGKSLPLCSEIVSLEGIAAKVRLVFQSCLKWGKRFMALCLKGLNDILAKEGLPE